ncbi:MAG: pyruvate kinase [Thermoplasmata archaeon]
MRVSRGSEDVASAAHLIRELERMRAEVVRLERRQPLQSFGRRRPSARNLVDYLAFRRFDARELQERLARLGLSSLGHAESHVRGNLDSVLRQLYLLTGRPVPARLFPSALGPESGRKLIDRHARTLLGPPRPGRRTRIMVTVPSEVATDASLVRELLEAGMDCMRINCAHDSPPVWSAMISHLRRAERGTGRRCRVEMDLSGPRLRTGPLAPGPAILKIRPTRNEFGRVLRPGSLWLVREGDPDPPAEEGIPAARVPGDWLSRRGLGSTIVLKDSRGSPRTFQVAAIQPGARLVATSKTVYLSNGVELRARSNPGAKWDVTNASIPAREGLALLRLGETVRLTSRAGVGHSDVRNEAGRLRSPATFPVLPPEALRSLRVGDHVWFDGGRVGGVATRVRSGEALLRVTHARPQGVRLGADKGLNLPDSALTIPPLTSKDLADLDFVVKHADLVGYSFVQSAADVRALRKELARRSAPEMGFVLKIETGRAFELLPEIMLASLHAPIAGVMIARGDLAVEVGYERLAEVQEEILWICEAAHVPVVWATQVLEELTKIGLPSRAEVTDAAMGARAECVMLNKGPHLVEAVRVLDNILRRMEAHQAKKSARLRHLHVAERFFEPADGNHGGAFPPNSA